MQSRDQDQAWANCKARALEADLDVQPREEVHLPLTKAIPYAASEGCCAVGKRYANFSRTLELWLFDNYGLVDSKGREQKEPSLGRGASSAVRIATDLAEDLSGLRARCHPVFVDQHQIQGDLAGHSLAKR